MEIFIFLGILIGIIIAFVVASEFASIADEKGYDGTKYFWYTLFLGIFGALMVIALPDRNSNMDIVHSPKHIDDKNYDNNTGGVVNNVFSNTKEKSENVANDLDADPSYIDKNTTFKTTENNTIVCSSCGYEQPAGRAVCWKCGSRFSQEDTNN